MSIPRGVSLNHSQVINERSREIHVSLDSYVTYTK